MENMSNFTLGVLIAGFAFAMWILFGFEWGQPQPSVVLRIPEGLGPTTMSQEEIRSAVAGDPVRSGMQELVSDARVAAQSGLQTLAESGSAGAEAASQIARSIVAVGTAPDASQVAQPLQLAPTVPVTGAAPLVSPQGTVSNPALLPQTPITPLALPGLNITADELRSLLTVEGYSAEMVDRVIDAAPMDAASKITMRAALQAAADQPPVLQAVLAQLRDQLGV